MILLVSREHSYLLKLEVIRIFFSVNHVKTTARVPTRIYKVDSIVIQVFLRAWFCIVHEAECLRKPALGKQNENEEVNRTHCSWKTEKILPSLRAMQLLLWLATLWPTESLVIVVLKRKFGV